MTFFQVFFRRIFPKLGEKESRAPKFPNMFVFDLTKNDVLDLADYQYIMSRIMEARKVDYPCNIFSRLSIYYVEGYRSAQCGLSV